VCQPEREMSDLRPICGPQRPSNMLNAITPFGADTVAGIGGHFGFRPNRTARTIGVTRAAPRSVPATEYSSPPEAAAACPEIRSTKPVGQASSRWERLISTVAHLRNGACENHNVLGRSHPLGVIESWEQRSKRDSFAEATWPG
jgi:hypothetical protein